MLLNEGPGISTRTTKTADQLNNSPYLHGRVYGVCQYHEKRRGCGVERDEKDREKNLENLGSKVSTTSNNILMHDNTSQPYAKRDV